MPKTAKSKASAVVLPKTEALEAELGALPTHEEIALRAYRIYLERGSSNGNAIDDWLQAERELLETK
jgi:hypothetical protein